MGLYNRDYYRELHRASSRGEWGIPGLTPVVKYIIFANVIVFLLQIFFVREVELSPREMIRRYNPPLDKLLTKTEGEGPEAVEALKKDYPEIEKMLSRKDLSALLFPYTEKVPIVQEWLELDADKVVYSGQVWRLLTHAFCHSRYDIFHILINMLLLYWFGCTLESMYGSREFFLFYLTAALAGGLAYIGLDLYTGTSTPAVGASGAVMGVMMLYTMHFPCETIFFCWFFPIQMRWLMVIYVIWEIHPVLLALSGDRMLSGIAHAAHLGGLAFGFFYAKFEWRIEPFLERISWPRWRWKRRPRLRLVELPPPEPEPDTDMERVDQVLQKIIASGQASLTEEERAILQTASARLKKRNEHSS